MPATKNDVALYSSLILANVVTNPWVTIVFFGLAVYHLVMVFYED